MRKQVTYVKHFETEDDALSRCEMKNKACRRAGNHRDIFAVVDGPDDDFSVVDLCTAIDMELGYRIVG